jgi:hypothetical protein
MDAFVYLVLLRSLNTCIALLSNQLSPTRTSLAVPDTDPASPYALIMTQTRNRLPWLLRFALDAIESLQAVLVVDDCKAFHLAVEAAFVCLGGGSRRLRLIARWNMFFQVRMGLGNVVADGRLR